MQLEMTEEQLKALLDAAYLCFYKRSGSPRDFWDELAREEPSPIGEDALYIVHCWLDEQDEE